jgi:hypothetical protein
MLRAAEPSTLPQEVAMELTSPVARNANGAIPGLQRERILSLEGDFDAPSFCWVRNYLRTATPTCPIVFDFSGVRFCQPFALAELLRIISEFGYDATVRGLHRGAALEDERRGGHHAH